jgi:hypothetical protein
LLSNSVNFKHKEIHEYLCRLALAARKLLNITAKLKINNISKNNSNPEEALPKEIEQSIAQMTGQELINYLNVLSQRQAAYSKLKIKATEDLIPIDQVRAAKKAEIQTIIERMKQCKIEIASTKYAIKSCAEGLS